MLHDPEHIGVIRASSNLLPMLGARPALGRLFVPEEDVPGAECAAVLGHGTGLAATVSTRASSALRSR